jgi:hypothetical protein
MDTIWNDGIKPGIEDAGFKPYRVKGVVQVARIREAALGSPSTPVALSVSVSEKRHSRLFGKSWLRNRWRSLARSTFGV